MIGVFQCLQRHDEDARRKIIFASARMVLKLKNFSYLSIKMEAVQKIDI